ncbi:hypothetical protein D3C76_1010760 [compost metagenome]
MRDKYGILGFDNYKVFHAYSCYQAVTGVHISVARALVEHISLESIALLVFLTYIPERGPRPYIAPPCIQRHHNGIRSLFHHCIINRVFRARRKSSVVDT